MKPILRLSVTLALLALMTTGARAAASNWWTNVTSGDYTNTANWSAGPLTATDWVFFTNAAASTVTFSTSVTNGPLVIYDSSPTFDLNGYIWKLNRDTYGAIIGTNTTGSMTVTFSSSAGPQVTGGNMVLIGDPLNDVNLIGSTGGVNGATKIVVDASQGNGVILRFGGMYGLGLSNAQLIVDGSGSELQVYDTRYGANVSGSVLITNNAVFRSAIPSYSWNDQVRFGGIKSGSSTAPYTTVTVANASMVLHGAMIGSDSGSAMLILRNSSLTSYGNAGTPFHGGDQDLQVGVLPYWGTGSDASLYKGDMLMDNSTVNAQSLTLGANWLANPTPGRLQVLNGSSLNLSNRLLVTSYHSATATNTLVLNNSTIVLGGGAVAGSLTNRGAMRAGGTIRGAGAGRLLVRNEGLLEVGNSVGTLVLSNANLELAAGSQTLFEFGETGLDQILVLDGYASVLGSNLFSLASGSAAPTPGVKWGLGVYDFIVASNITWNVQYDNLTSNLTAWGLTQNLDYRYGLVTLNDGSQILRLEFVPEPSTVLLLLGGGLVVYRWRRRG